MIKAILFDFDGVIHDTLEILHPIAYEVQGITLEEYKDKFNGNVWNGATKNKEKLEKFHKLQQERYKPLKIEKEIKNELQILNKTYPLYIISSNHEKILKEYFENNGILKIFKEVLGAETHKSKHEKFRIILKKHKLSPDECIFVTDTLGDILEANKIPIKTIAVDFGFHDKERLEKGNPWKIVSDFKEIRKTLEIN